MKEQTSIAQEVKTEDEERISSSDAKTDHAEPQPLHSYELMHYGSRRSYI